MLLSFRDCNSTGAFNLRILANYMLNFFFSIEENEMYEYDKFDSIVVVPARFMSFSLSSAGFSFESDKCRKGHDH